MSRQGRWASALCLLIGLTGCGTTVPLAQRATGDAELSTTPGNSGLGPPAPAAGGSSPAGASGLAGPSGSANVGPAGSGPRAAHNTPAGSAGPGSTRTAARSSASHAPVRPGAPVLIGYATEKDITGVASSLGISGVNGGDIEAQLHAVVHDINTHGGLAGHQIQLREHDFNSQQRIDNPAGAAQAACQDWTQDHHVFAVVDSYVTIAVLPGMLDCLTKAGVPLVSDWPTDDANDAAYASHPLFASPSSMTVDSYIPAEVDRLYADGFFTGWNTTTGRPGTAPVRIGTESFDDPAGRHYVAVLRAALARHGLKLYDVESHDRGPSAAAAGASSAVLKFHSDGITHVFYANILFYKDAENQGYRPRYAVDDLIGPALLAQNVDAAELHGAMGSGYQPLNEVANAADPNAAGGRCLAVMRAAGQVPSSQLAKLSMFEMCAHWYLLQRIFAGTSALTVAAFQRGLESLGTSYNVAPTYGTHFGPSRHFGADALRDYAYNDACGCFRFTSTALHEAR